MELSGKIALITGGANGIGRATALAFADKGCDVAIADLEADRLKEVRSLIEERGRRVIDLVTDVAKEDQVTSMIERTIDELGGLDLVVNNAGVSVSGPPELTPIEDWRWIVDVNMWAHVYAVRAALPYFKEKRSGYFVHVSSILGIAGSPIVPAYSMTKYAVFGLAMSLATSLVGSGIGVSVVCPMWVDTDIALRGRNTTDLSLQVDAETARKFAREMIRQRGISPEKVAESIVDGVAADRFLILPHPDALNIVQSQWTDIEGFVARAMENLMQGRAFSEPQ